MSYSFSAHCDEYHISTRLFLKLDLGMERETVLHFFDSVKREFPTMRRLRRRDDAGLVLEDDEGGNPNRCWLRLDESSIRLGHQNPESPEDVERLSKVVLNMAPYHLTLGDLDYDHMEVVIGFDLEYRGNHDQLIAETFFSEGPLAPFLLHSPSYQVIDAQPFLGISLNEDCDTQAYVEIKSRTTTFEIRTGSYDPQSLTVFLTLRRFWGFRDHESLITVHRQLMDHAYDIAESKVIPLVVQPLAQAIASRP